MMKHSYKTAAAHLAALFTILIWGTTFISTKMLLVNFTPVEILFFRFTIGYIVLLVVHPHFIKTRKVQEELLFIIAGLCGVTLYFLLENVALTYTLASNVGVIVSIAPFFTAVLTHFFLEGERLRPQFFVGFVVAIIGIIIIGWNRNFVLKLNPIGDVLAILASVVWALYTILMKKISKLGYNTLGCTHRIFFYGLLFMIPMLFLSNFHLDFNQFTARSNLLNILFLGLGASALCFTTWNWCVGILGAVKTSAYIYMVPVVTIVASYFTLHESITKTALLGTLFTLAGLFLSEKKNGEKIKLKEVDI